MIAKHQLVRVSWDDTEEPKGGWQDEAEVATFAAEETLVSSVGFVVSDTDKYLTISGDYIKKLGHYGRVMKIARPQVVSVEEL